MKKINLGSVLLKNEWSIRLNGFDCCFLMQDSEASKPAGMNTSVVNLLAGERVRNGGSSSQLRNPNLAQDCVGQNISNFNSVYEQVIFMELLHVMQSSLTSFYDYFSEWRFCSWFIDTIFIYWKKRRQFVGAPVYTKFPRVWIWTSTWSVHWRKIEIHQPTSVPTDF